MICSTDSGCSSDITGESLRTPNSAEFEVVKFASPFLRVSSTFEPEDGDAATEVGDARGVEGTDLDSNVVTGMGNKGVAGSEGVAECDDLRCIKDGVSCTNSSDSAGSFGGECGDVGPTEERDGDDCGCARGDALRCGPVDIVAVNGAPGASAGIVVMLPERRMSGFAIIGVPTGSIIAAATGSPMCTADGTAHRRHDIDVREAGAAIAPLGDKARGAAIGMMGTFNAVTVVSPELGLVGPSPVTVLLSPIVGAIPRSRIIAAATGGIVTLPPASGHTNAMLPPLPLSGQDERMLPGLEPQVKAMLPPASGRGTLKLPPGSDHATDMLPPPSFRGTLRLPPLSDQGMPTVSL